MLVPAAMYIEGARDLMHQREVEMEHFLPEAEKELHTANVLPSETKIESADPDLVFTNGYVLGLFVACYLVMSGVKVDSIIGGSV